MISSPSSCEAASTRSAISAGCRLASLRWEKRRRALGTWPTNGSMSVQSRNGRSPTSPRRRRGSSRRSCARGAVVDADDPPPALDAGELDLVRGHEPRRIGLDVDELAPEHVLAEQHLAGAALEAPEAELLAGQPHRAGRERRDPVDRHEQLAPADPAPSGRSPADSRRRPGARSGPRPARAARPPDRAAGCAGPTRDARPAVAQSTS